MTLSPKEKRQLKREIDRRARERQTWWDEYEAFLEDPVFCTCQQISHDPRDCAIHGEALRKTAVAA